MPCRQKPVSPSHQSWCTSSNYVPLAIVLHMNVICNMQVVGPTIGFILGVCMAIICWPCGLLVSHCR